jgi:hypothetical protein
MFQEKMKHRLMVARVVIALMVVAIFLEAFFLFSRLTFWQRNLLVLVTSGIGLVSSTVIMYWPSRRNLTPPSN